MCQLTCFVISHDQITIEVKRERFFFYLWKSVDRHKINFPLSTINRIEVDIILCRWYITYIHSISTFKPTVFYLYLSIINRHVISMLLNFICIAMYTSLLCQMLCKTLYYSIVLRIYILFVSHSRRITL